MSKVAISGNASGTGVFTIQSPNGNTDRVLTLPDVTDTVAGIAATQTLTNKTLTSPTIATPTMTGQATIPTINLTGGQITFPATQSASSDANTLDDYEEGTWTPTQGAGLTVVGTFSSNGSYIKIGKQVTVIGRVGATTSVAATANNILCAGLPFTSTVTSIGSSTNSALSQAGAAYIESGTNVYSTAMSATANIFFTVTYSI